MRKVPTIIVSVLAVLVLVLGGGYFWFASSVYPAFANLSVAIKNKNLDEVKKYLDTDKVANSFFSAVQAALPEVTANTNTSIVKESIEKAIKDGEFITNSGLVDSQTEAYRSNKLVADGSSYRWKVELYSAGSGVENTSADFYFTKENGIWKVTKMVVDLSKLFGDVTAGTKSNQ